MDGEKPVQPEAPKAAFRWWSARRVCGVLALLFAMTFTAAWWLTPIEPYLTLNLDEPWSCCGFSPDGTVLVTSGFKDSRRSGPLRIWDVERGHERISLAHDWNAIYAEQFSPDGILLTALDGEGDFKLWNARTGEELASLAPKIQSERNFRFSPDGRSLVFQERSPDKQCITFWNVESRREHGRVESDFHSLTFAPDGDSFATARHDDTRKVNEVFLWKMAHVPVLVKQHSIPAEAVALSPDLKTFATVDDLPDGNCHVAIWDMMTGKKRWSVVSEENGKHFDSLSFSANGKVLSASGGRMPCNYRTTLWDMASTPKEIRSFSDRVVVSPDGEWLAVPLQEGVTLIKVSAPGHEANLIVSGAKRTDGRGRFSPDSKMVLISLYFEHQPFLRDWLPEKYNPFRAGPRVPVVRVWDTDSRREVATFRDCRHAWFSSDGKVLATLRGGNAIDLWRVPFRASLWRILGWTVLAWLIVVAVGWAGGKMQRRMFSRTNAPPQRPESSDGKPPASKE